MNIQEFVEGLVVSPSELKYCSDGSGGDNKARGKFLRKVLTKEVLYEFIVIQNLPSNYIRKQLSKKISIGVAAIIKISKEYGIPTNGIKEQNSRRDIQKRRQETFFTKYGSEFPLSKSSPFFNKRNETVKSKYGVDNVFQLDHVKQKSVETMMERYGVANTVFLDSFKRNNGTFSFQHKMVENFLEEEGIIFDSEYGKKGCPFKKFNKFLNKEYSPIVDIHIPNKMLIIEIYGDVWHANPKKYKDDDWIETWRGKLQAKDIREFDKFRREQLESFGYRVLEIWGSDVMKNFDDVKKIIINYVIDN